MQSTYIAFAQGDFDSVVPAEPIPRNHRHATAALHLGPAAVIYCQPYLPPPERMSETDTHDCGCLRADQHRETPPSPARRRFLNRMSIALGGVAAALAGLPLVGYLFSPVIRRQPEAWRHVGAVTDIPVGDTVMVRYMDPDPVPWAGYAGRSAAWVRRDPGDQITAFSMYCTHAGCPITWSRGAQMFMCPCHGGVFHRDGSVAAGPPPRPLERLPVRIRNGQVELRTIGAPRTDVQGAT